MFCPNDMFESVFNDSQPQTVLHTLPPSCPSSVLGGLYNTFSPNLTILVMATRLLIL